MKNSKKALSLMMASALVFTSTPHQFIVNALTQYQPGVTVEKNSTGKSDADYQATFVYEDTDERNAVSVNVLGGFQFYKEDEIGGYEEPDDPRTPVYSAYQYEKGMFPTGYVVDGTLMKYDMTEVKDETFEISLPLPGNLYYYDYEVTYDDGTTVTIQDPSNKSPNNSFNGHDAGHSLLYVGDSCMVQGTRSIVATSVLPCSTGFAMRGSSGSSA